MLRFSHQLLAIDTHARKKDGLVEKSESVKTIVSRRIAATLIASAAVGFAYAQAERSSGVVIERS